MNITSFDEIKAIVGAFPKASGVGYAITPQLLKIANEIGLVGYSEALRRWDEAQVTGEHVYVKGEELPSYIPFAVDWNGPSIMIRNGTVLVGLKRTIENIEQAIK